MGFRRSDQPFGDQTPEVLGSPMLFGWGQPRLEPGPVHAILDVQGVQQNSGTVLSGPSLMGGDVVPVDVVSGHQVFDQLGGVHQGLDTVPTLTYLNADGLYVPGSHAVTSVPGHFISGQNLDCILVIHDIVEGCLKGRVIVTDIVRFILSSAPWVSCGMDGDVFRLHGDAGASACCRQWNELLLNHDYLQKRDRGPKAPNSVYALPTRAL